MKGQCRRLFQCITVCFAILLMALPVYGQQQTPTSPAPVPDAGAIRQRLQNISPNPFKDEKKKSLKEKKEAKKEDALKDEVRPLSKPEANPKAPTPQKAKGESEKNTVPKETKPAVRTLSPMLINVDPSVARVIESGHFEPYREKDLIYPELPDVGEPLTLNGPMSVGDFLDTLSMTTNWNILVTSTAKDVQLQYWLVNTRPNKAMDVLKFHDIHYDFDAETNYLTVMTKAEFLAKEYGKPREHEFVIQHAPIDYMESVITSLLSPSGRLLTDPRTNHIFVWDGQENIDEMTETVAQLDVPLKQAEFTAKYTDVADAEAILSALLSPGGTVIADARTGRLLVQDSEENIKKMQMAMKGFDVPVETRMVPLKYANVGSVLESVETMVSERGAVRADVRSNTLVISDIPSRIDGMANVALALDKGMQTRTWTLEYIEPQIVAERIGKLVPEEMGNIIINEDVHQITVSAIGERIADIDSLINEWDVRRQQVQIEAYLVSVNDTLARSLDIRWSYFDNIDGNPVAFQSNGGASPDYSRLNNTATIGQLPYPEILTEPFTGPVKDIEGNEVIDKLRGSSLAATLDYLDTRGQASILSSPRVTVQDGEEAIFSSGRNVPYVTSTVYSAGLVPSAGDNDNDNINVYGYRPYNKIDFIEVGTILRVLPRITDTGTVLLDIQAEDSDATMVKVIANGEENTIPEKRENRSETQVRVQDGQTIVIGGLRKANNEKDVSKSVPVLSEIPLLGKLFKTTSRDVVNNTLMIFLTTTVVNESTQPEAQRLAAIDEEFAKTYRQQKKNSFARLGDKMTRGKDEIIVSVGQSGHMFSEEQEVTLNDVRLRLNELKNPACATLVVRKHPRAPQAVLDALGQLAVECGVRIHFDNSLSAFVPDYSAISGPDRPAPESSLDGATPVLVEATEERQ